MPDTVLRECDVCDEKTNTLLSLIGLRAAKVCRPCSSLWVQTYQSEVWYREILQAADAAANAGEASNAEERRLTRSGSRKLKEAAEHGNVRAVERIKAQQVEEFKKIDEWKKQQRETMRSERIKLEDFVHNDAIDEAYATLRALASAPG